MKKLFLFAAAAAMFAACTSSDSLGDGQNQSQKSLEPGAVGFEAYTQRATTRAGQADVMDIDKLKETEANGGGFGVFAYYTNNNEYEQSRLPDFMYNQKVIWNSTYWAYEPVKYWPNEYGNSANSDDNDKVSFFAYAPYVQVNPGTGKVVKTNSTDDQWGITGMSRNTVSGDPLVKYIANFETGKNVDLLWGVCDDPQWSLIQGGTIQQINEGELGLPWLNVERPRIANTQSATTDNQRLKFTFKHALAQLSVNVDAFVDGYNADNALADKTKIYVRSISFTGFALKGALNLNNTDANTALWMDYNGTGEIETGTPITIYDGRKDGKEGTAGADATNEKQRGLNPDIISDYNEGAGQGNTTPGVTNVTRRLFETTSPVMVIPTGEDMEVQIVYDVETEDANLSTNLSDGKTKGSSIENRISKTVSFGANGMQNGKHYTLNLHLGMNSVKFDAEVSGWQEAGEKPGIDLPLNMPSFQATNSPTTTNDVELSNEAQPYVFAVYGLTPGETVTATLGGSVVSGDILFGQTFNVNSKGDLTGTSGVADASGVAYVEITGGFAANATVNKIAKGNGYLSVKGTTSNKEVQVTFAQAAGKLGLGVASFGTSNENTLHLTTTASGTAWTSEVSSITVKKNGLPVTGTWTEATSAGTSLGTYVLPSNVAIGDVYEITVTAGDAPEESFVANIGGIKLNAASGTITYRESTAKTFDAIGHSLISNTTPAVTWSEAGSGATITLNTTAGTFTTVKSGSETITASISPADDLTNGWYYTDATKTKNYALTIIKQNSVLTFNNNSATITSPTTGATVLSDIGATFLGAIDNTTSAGSVTYTITSYGLAANTDFGVSGTALVIGTTVPAAGTYTLTIQATGTGTTDKYNDAVAVTATVTVTVN